MAIVALALIYTLMLLARLYSLGLGIGVVVEIAIRVRINRVHSIMILVSRHSSWVRTIRVHHNDATRLATGRPIKVL